MKIVHMVQTLDVGGLEHLVVQMAHEQTARGHAVAIVCLGNEGELAAKARHDGVRVSSLAHPGGFSFGLILKLRHAIAQSGADIVHTHNMGPLIYGSMAARLTGVRCINTRHGRAVKKAPSWIWNSNEFVVAVSEDAKTRVVEFNRIKPDKVRMIHNGIRLGYYHRTESTEDAEQKVTPVPELGEHGTGQAPETKDNLSDFRHQASDFLIGTVGRLSWEKNQALLLRAFASLKEKVKDTSLVIVGDGKDRLDLEKQALKLGIQDFVKFLGYRDDVPELMVAMDVFVLPSLEEGLSLTLLEAMAASLPVVATDVGGNGEAVVDGETGILVPSGDAEALAEALLKLHNDKELRHKMGAAGRRRIESHFSLKFMVDEYMDLYKLALE